MLGADGAARHLQLAALAHSGLAVLAPADHQMLASGQDRRQVEMIHVDDRPQRVDFDNLGLFLQSGDTLTGELSHAFSLFRLG